MSSQIYNNTRDTLASAIDNVQTSFDVTSGDIPALDDGDYIPVHVIRASDNAFEIMHVTGVSGTTLTVDRAAEPPGDSPLTFNSGDSVEIRPTRQSLLEMLDIGEKQVTTETGTQSLSSALDDRATESRVDDQEYYRTIESFGPVDTPANTLSTMQAAIDFAATNKILLRAKSSEYTLDLSSSSITIPNDFRCDLGGAVIKRQTGNTTPQDMWINLDTTNGNTGLDIRNVTFDGQRQADALTNTDANHRFCGLRLVKCTGYLENIRSDNTVNGEIQVEGNRGGIILDESVDILANNLFADGTDGSGVFTYKGMNRIYGVYTKNNNGSGFTSFGCDGNEFHHIHSDTSGFSGVSVNGVNMRCSFLVGKNAPLGFAGVNIGHDTAGNRSDGSIIDNVYAEDNLGWGITVIGSSAVIGSNWVATNSAVRNIRVFNSPGVRIQNAKTRDSQSNDVEFEGAGDHFIDIDGRAAEFSGVRAFNGAKVTISSDSILAQYGIGGGTTGAVLCEAGSRVIMRGQAVGNNTFGLVSSGSGAVIESDGAFLDNNTSGDTFTGSGGAIQFKNTKTSNDSMNGTFVISNGTTSAVVNNGNSILPERIAIYASDGASRSAGIPVISTISVGTSFTASIGSPAGSDLTYRYTML